MNRVVVYSSATKATKTQLKTLKKIEDNLEKEMFRQVAIISGSAGIALYENWGWRQQRIAKLFNEINQVWSDVSKDPYMSVLRLCEEETGIIINIPEYDGNYKELTYFKDNAVKEQLTINQRIYMRIQQKKWLGPEMIASVLISLHRIYGFGYERLAKFLKQMFDVRDRYNWDDKVIEEECFRITNVSMSV